jgi:hypothetical protein
VADKYSIKKYAIGLETLCHRIRDGIVDAKLIALGSLVLLVVEVLQSHEEAALTHFQSGETVLRSLDASRECGHQITMNHATASPLNRSCHGAGDIASAFTGVSVQELYIGASNSNSAGMRVFPIRFSSIIEARTLFNAVSTVVFAFLRRHAGRELKILSSPTTL